MLRRHVDICGAIAAASTVGVKPIGNTVTPVWCTGHNIEMDVKFLIFKGTRNEEVRRFQFTAIDDATRVRALKIYEKHTQASAIDFVDHIIEKFSFRIREIRTDNGHEFQAQFHWHVEGEGIRHAYIRRGTP